MAVNSTGMATASFFIIVPMLPLHKIDKLEVDRDGTSDFVSHAVFLERIERLLQVRRLS